MESNCTCTDKEIKVFYQHGNDRYLKMTACKMCNTEHFELCDFLEFIKLNGIVELNGK